MIINLPLGISQLYLFEKHYAEMDVKLLFDKALKAAPITMTL